jgi:hypothetical protein
MANDYTDYMNEYTQAIFSRDKTVLIVEGKFRGDDSKIENNLLFEEGIIRNISHYGTLIPEPVMFKRISISSKDLVLLAIRRG